MCGIAGFLSARADASAQLRLRQMGCAVAHRGPDAEGYFLDPSAGVGLAHRRLAIVDLTDAGSQPMQSPSGRYQLIFNGEIYNHDALRRDLEARADRGHWRGHSDTETLLAGFEAWGIQETITRSVGMFAIAVWDAERRVLTLVRDRLGEKPLYYGWHRDVFLFGSELKALRAHPAFDPEIDRDAITLLMRHNAIPAPHSIYRKVAKLAPGCLLKVSLESPDPKIAAYWSGVEAALAGAAHPYTGSDHEALDDLETVLSSAVRGQMMSDVPLGAFLSGGIDSSTIVALMQAQSKAPIRTFSIGFHETRYNEAEHARQVAAHLGTEHTEVYLTPDDARAVIPSLPSMYDEPFADSSQIPTHLLSRIARRDVTVALSGDAGDEVFGGYNRYALAARYWSRLSTVPVPLRRLAAAAMTSVSPGVWDRAGLSLAGDKLHKAAGVLASRSAGALYFGLVSHWNNPASIVIDGHEPPTLLSGREPDLSALDDVERMMALDLVSYLPDDILAKVDRAAMAVSLETRVPFLDHRVVEFAWRLPLHMKIRDGETKWVLRQLAYKHVPRELLDRPKQGFGVPLADWLRGPLRGWAEALLDERRLREEGFFRPEPIRRKLAEHMSGRRNWAHHLWTVLMFGAWLEQQSVELAAG